MAKLFSVFTAICLLIVPFGTLPVSAEEKTSAVLFSPGLDVIAASCELIVSTTPDKEAILTAEDFEHATGAGFKSITLCTRPDATVGQLLSGSLVVPAGQTVTAADLSRRSLSFVPSASVVSGDTAEFTFTADGSPYAYTCRIVVTDAAKSNSAPRLDCATSASLTALTYTGYVCGGQLSGIDPDGDALMYEIVNYPSHGCLTLTDASAGTYLYRPASGYSGKDSFTYTVRDSLGNYADGTAKVSVNVSRYNVPVDFADMSGAAECAALTVTAAGLMSGTQTGSTCYFNPDQTVSRAEFIVMLMTAAGMKNMPDADKTVFSDDADIQSAMKPYVAAAYELGYTNGWIVDGKQCFKPNEPITTAEAAVLTAAVLGIPTDDAVPASAAGSLGAPSWAKDAVSTLTAGGFSLTALSADKVTAGKLLDREDAAVLLCAVMRCTE
ncbi:MAG: S-layer homology domain-containing protein [Clostridia bacterium]|nr:S-layer homology domain-containing protein [Clostridia bacterium]